MPSPSAPLRRRWAETGAHRSDVASKAAGAATSVCRSLGSCDAAFGHTRAHTHARTQVHSTPLCRGVTYLWLLALLDWVLLRGSTAPLPSRLGERRLLLAETDGPEMVVTIVCVRGIRCTLCRGRMAYSSLCCFLGVGLSGGRGRRAAIPFSGVCPPSSRRPIHLPALDEGGIPFPDESTPMQAAGSRTKHHSPVRVHVIHC